MPATSRRRAVFFASAPAADRSPCDEAAAAAGLALTDRVTDEVVGVLAADGPGARLAAAAAERLDLPWHPRSAVDVSLDPLLARGCFMAAGLRVPWFFSMPPEATLAGVADRVRFPCVVKPAGRRGAVRVGDPSAFDAAVGHVRESLARREADDDVEGADRSLLVEAFVPGEEVVLQGVMTAGALHVLAVVDAPGAASSHDRSRAVAGLTAHAAAALGLRHGPVHAVCRVHEQGVVVLGLWPWPIEAGAAGALRFATREGVEPSRDGITLSELLLRHAVGESLDDYGRIVD
jgi:hypothetical protein